MQSVSDKFKAAEAMHGLGEASKEARQEAYNEAEAEYFRKEAYADEMADEQEEREMRQTQDYNDAICVDSGGVTMRLYYMCARRDPNSYDNSLCGIYMPGKILGRRGAAPKTCDRWYCEPNAAEWGEIISKQLMPESNGGHRADFNLDRAMNGDGIGCTCRFHPFRAGGSMVLEVIDKSVAGTCSLWAIRAAIPPGPLSDEIQNVRTQGA